MGHDANVSSSVYSVVPKEPRRSAES